nr:metallopeptidase family protein [Microbacterium humi]
MFSRRAVRHDRHGRSGRSSVLRPPLRPLGGRVDLFDVSVAAAADYLRDAYPSELGEVSFGIAGMPSSSSHDDGIDRWSIDRERRQIVVYRVPIQRLIRLHIDDSLHRRMAVESCVFQAAAEYLGLDPWDLDPGGFGPL